MYFKFFFFHSETNQELQLQMPMRLKRNPGLLAEDGHITVSNVSETMKRCASAGGVSSKART